MAQDPDFTPESINRQINSVHQRTLIAVQPEDMYRWSVKASDREDALIGNKGYEDLLAYQQIVTPSELDDQNGKRNINKHNIKSADQAVRRALNVLEASMPKDAQKNLDPKAYKRQLMTAARALSGEFGDEVTLANLDEPIAQALGVALTKQEYSGKSEGLHYSVNGVDHPLQFLKADGVVSGLQGHQASKFPDPPKDPKYDYSQHEQDVQDSFSKGKPKQIEAEKRGVQLKQQNDMNAYSQQVQQQRGRRKGIDFE